MPVVVPVAIRVGALVNICAPTKPIVPPPEVKVKVPAVDILVAAAWLIVPVPVPVAFKVTEEPVILALTAIEPLVPACKVNAPVAVMVSDAATVMLPVALVLVKLNINPVDAPPVDTVAAESVM